MLILGEGNVGGRMLVLEVGIYEKTKRSPPSLSGVDKPSPLAQLWPGTLNHWGGNGCGRGKRYSSKCYSKLKYRN